MIKVTLPYGIHYKQSKTSRHFKFPSPLHLEVSTISKRSQLVLGIISCTLTKYAGCLPPSIAGLYNYLATELQAFMLILLQNTIIK